jgi:hypothetical protein
LFKCERKEEEGPFTGSSTTRPIAWRRAIEQYHGKPSITTSPRPQIKTKKNLDSLPAAMDMVVVTVLGGPKRPDPRGFAKGGGTKDHDERVSDLRNFSISPSDLLDINVLDLYCEFWEWERFNGNGCGAGTGISFDAESASSPLATSKKKLISCPCVVVIFIGFCFAADLPNMEFTDGPRIPEFARTMPTLQVYAMKVTRISHPLQWPLDVYGVVAVRDYKNSKRNILFRRDRDNFQTLISLKV